MKVKKLQSANKHLNALLLFQLIIIIGLVSIIIYQNFNSSVVPFIFIIYSFITFFALPSKWILSPKVFIFGFYFLWYGLSPFLSSQHLGTDYYFKESSLKAYGMITFNYTVAISLITFFENKEKFKSTGNVLNKKSSFTSKNNEADFKLVRSDITESLNISNMRLNYIILGSFLLAVIGFYLYILNTGGIDAWMQSSKVAFIARGGAGAYYLLFTHALVVLFFSVSVRAIVTKRYILLILSLPTIIFLYPFIGSKLKVLLMLLMLVAPLIVRLKFWTKYTLILVVVGIIVFVLGMKQRMGRYLTVDNFLSVILGYFDTFDLLVLSIEKIAPSLLLTALLPLNKVLLPLGHYISAPFFDMSVWFTEVFFPHVTAQSGTVQWPIETDMYLSFWYLGGIPFFVLYIFFLSYLFKKARTGNVIWALIYVIEFTQIISHLRGGILIWWFWYQVPFYVVLLLLFKNFNFDKILKKIRKE